MPSIKGKDASDTDIAKTNAPPEVNPLYESGKTTLKKVSLLLLESNKELSIKFLGIFAILNWNCEYAKNQRREL